MSRGIEDLSKAMWWPGRHHAAGDQKSVWAIATPPAQAGGNDLAPDATSALYQAAKFSYVPETLLRHRLWVDAAAQSTSPQRFPGHSAASQLDLAQSSLLAAWPAMAFFYDPSFS